MVQTLEDLEVEKSESVNVGEVSSIHIRRSRYGEQEKPELREMRTYLCDANCKNCYCASFNKSN